MINLNEKYENYMMFKTRLMSEFVCLCNKQSPRRNCCRVMKSKEKKTLMVEVGMCKEGEISEV